VVHWLRLAGLENGVVNLINALRARFRHTVICMAEVGVLAKRLPPEVRVIDLSTTVRRGPLFIFRLASLLRSLRPDIVHSRNWGTIDAVIAAWLAGVPVRIHGEHGRTAEDPKGQNRRRNIGRRLVSPFVDRFVTVSDDLRRWLTSEVGVPAHKVVRIHNGVDVERFSGGGREAGRRALGLAEDDIVVGAVGRLDRVKDHRTLLEAFSRVDNRSSHCRLVIVGEGELRSELEMRAAQPDLRGRVDLPGERPDVSFVLKGFNIFVISSIAEGISNTVLEAMATALPIVATRTGGNPELVEEGVNGMLVPVGDAEALGRAIAIYLNDPMRALQHGAASRQRAVERFSLPRMAHDYATLYLSLLEHARLATPRREL
jgi:sugar transferase (PEP-CTERM/EpsH1 system associated)